jgi:hypothetical protein
MEIAMQQRKLSAKGPAWVKTGNALIEQKMPV